MNDLGRVTTAYVSGYQRWRVHSADVYGGEVRTLVGNFNGCMPVGDTIVAVRWDTWNAGTVFMGTGVIETGLRSVSLDIRAQYAGLAIVRCKVTTAEGGVYVVNYRINVNPSVYYGDEAWTTGPSSVVVP